MSAHSERVRGMLVAAWARADWAQVCAYALQSHRSNFAGCTAEDAALALVPGIGKKGFWEIREQREAA